MFRSRRLVLTLALATLAAACGDAGTDETTVAPTETTADQTTEGTTTGGLDWIHDCNPSEQSTCANVAPGQSVERENVDTLRGDIYGCDIHLSHFFADSSADDTFPIDPIEAEDLFSSGEPGENEDEATQIIEFFEGAGLGLFELSQPPESADEEIQADALFSMIDGIQDAGLAASPHYLLTPVPTWKYGPHSEVKRLDPKWTWDDLEITGPGSPVKARVIVVDTGAIGDVSPINPGTAEVEGAVDNVVVGHGVFAASIVKKYNPSLTVDIYRGGFLDGTLSEASVAAAIRRAAPSAEDVVNLSLGTYPCGDRYQPIGLALALPELVVAAAGNDGDQPDSQQMYPASLPNVTGVGALDHNWLPTSWSNPADEYAPGEDVVGWYDDGSGGSLAVWSGTSFAAPHFAACLASNEC